MERPRKPIPLHVQIFIGLLVGAVAGIAAQSALGADSQVLKDFITTWTRPVGQIFLRLIFMVVVPLLFSALVLGVAEIGDVRKIGRIGMRSLLMTVVLSGVAVAIALAVANIGKPGMGISPEARANFLSTLAKNDAVKKAEANAAKALSPTDQVIGLVSDNPLKDATDALSGGLLPFMVFALIFGVALASIEPEKALPVIRFLEGIFAVCLKIIEWVMKVAPIAVVTLVFGSVALLGWASLQQIGYFVILVLVALAVHQFGVYSLAIWLVAKRNPLVFFRQIRTVMMTAFATSSSNATLPVALKAAQEDVGLPKDISSFVLTVGATANQNGTALFEGITVLFLANFFGIPLGFGQQVTVLLLAIVAGVGTAGVPGGSWPMIMVLMARIGIPPEAAGLVIGVDRILDMSRTVLNVTGDITIATCVSAMEGGDQRAKMEAIGEA
ncbi:MAG: dicarboxylate/amino acid:cation symporter [Armatimonadetes bacterium]|nr:dicarboxylate/amino acid:cation symporter [Armatimonadota bacterium]